MQVKVKESVSPLRRARSHMDIMAAILNEAIIGVAKTRVKYRCNLSYGQLKVYLKLLSHMRLVTLVSKSGSTAISILKTSAKGLEFLHAYRKLKALLT